MITPHIFTEGGLYRRTSDGLCVRGQFVSGEYTHATCLDEKTREVWVFRLEEFFADFELVPVEEEPPKPPTFKADAQLTLVTLEQRDIEIDGELWGHALTTRAGGWMIYHRDWEDPDLEYVDVVETIEEIGPAVREWREENEEEE